MEREEREERKEREEREEREKREEASCACWCWSPSIRLGCWPCPSAAKDAWRTPNNTAPSDASVNDSWAGGLGARAAAMDISIARSARVSYHFSKGQALSDARADHSTWGSTVGRNSSLRIAAVVQRSSDSIRRVSSLESSWERFHADARIWWTNTLASMKPQSVSPVRIITRFIALTASIEVTIAITSAQTAANTAVSRILTGTGDVAVMKATISIEVRTNSGSCPKSGRRVMQPALGVSMGHSAIRLVTKQAGCRGGLSIT
mmetsp:Transcript_23050/g.70581  ORF Transcript_23050/g.70581 Transcript_23050/m.70581 type:complete len:263 (-) Transcript_23050:1351-2139(-)